MPNDSKNQEGKKEKIYSARFSGDCDFGEGGVISTDLESLSKDNTPEMIRQLPKCTNTTCRTLQEQGLEPLEHNGCPDKTQNEAYTTENAVKDICTIETVQYASKSEVKRIVDRLADQKLKEGLERAVEAVEKKSKEPYTQYGECSELHFGDAITAIKKEIDKLTK